MDDTEFSKERKRSAGRFRIIMSIIFLMLVLSAFLPIAYNLSTYAFPFGISVIGYYFFVYQDVADLKNGSALLVVIIWIMAALYIQTHFKYNSQLDQVKSVCSDVSDDVVIGGKCDEIIAILRNEARADYEETRDSAY